MVNLVPGAGVFEGVGPNGFSGVEGAHPSAWRRKGAGRALLNYIIDVACSRKYQILYLETGGHTAFVPAQTLYGSAGFKRCGPFGAYRENGNSVFMSLSLSHRAR